MMDEKKENNNDEIVVKDEVVVKKPTEVNVSATFKNDAVVSNGQITETSYALGKSYYNNQVSSKGLNLDDLHAVYVNSGNSASAAYQYLTNYISENKNDPEALHNTISLLLNDLGAAYDSTQTHGKVGMNQEEVLDKILSSDKGDEVKALICGTIHDFCAQALEDGGVEACLVTGGDRPGGEPHATLLYKTGEGKYVFNNYGENAIIEASNIKDAVREVYKNSGTLESSGTIQIKDKDNSSYQEFAFKEEAAFGNEMDKRDYNNKSPFDNSVASRPSINGNVSISSVGNISASAGGTLAYGNSSSAKETSIDVEYKNSKESSMFLNSQSIGLKVGHKTENQNGVFTDTKAIVSNTSGTIGGNSYKGEVAKTTETEDTITNTFVVGDQAISCTGKDTQTATATQIVSIDHDEEKADYLSAMVRTEVGKKTTLVQNENMELTNVSKGSFMFGGTLGLNDAVSQGASADGRITLESGFGLQNQVGKDITLSNTLSGGIVADALETCDGFKLTPGVKLNASTGVNYMPSENLQVGAGLKGYSVFTKSSTDYGIEGGLGAQYRSNGSNVTIFGAVNARLERQNLSVGTIHEKTENNMTINTTLGAQLSRNSQVYVSYLNYRNALNHTRNYNQVEIGAKFTF